MWLYKGRITRTEYFIAFTIYVLATVFVSTSLGDVPHQAALIAFLINILFLPFSIKRFHDMGVSGWLSLLLFIPIVGIILGTALIFQSGEHKTNKYGHPPR